ncbi:MAG: AmmeMemoRadiSam system protein B [Thermoproteota archaeon]|nr:AmmeMemoRadiSam system protein B [Thermoproteota archaeon]
MIRRAPAVAGMFYPDNVNELRALIERCFLNQHFGPGRIATSTIPTNNQRRIYGIVSPHAGYAYSGAVAANGFSEAASTDFHDVIMVGPNHYGIGSWVAAMKDGIWETPLGDVQVNSQVAEKIRRRSTALDFDDYAHSRDHCLEVQLPFLQYIKQDFKIVPVVLVSQNKDIALDLGNAISQTIMEMNTLDSTLLLASSDFTHYEPNSEAHKKDGELIKTILSLDINRFYTVLERMNISACGYGAIATMMTAAKNLGATRGELLKYATSGDVTGDVSAVVGYSSIVFL